MRIGIDLTERGGRPTGIQVVAEGLAQALAARGDLEVVPLAPPRGRMSTLARILWDQHGLPAAAARRRVDLLHHTGFSVALCAAMPRVATVHDLIPLTDPDEVLSPSARLYWRGLLPYSLRAAARLACDSGHTRDELVRLYPFLARRARVIAPGLSPGRTRPVDPARREALAVRLGLPRRYILAVGSELPRKDLPTLVRAFDLLGGKPGFADLELVLAGGPGPGTEALLRALAASPLRGRVRRLGYVPEADLAALLAGASVLAMPSRAEGFGLPPLEAMAHGVPVVAAAASSLPEVVGLVGLLVPPGDAAALATALARALDDAGLRSWAAGAGPRRAAAFTWARAAGEYAALYREVLGTGVRRMG